jgi:hypothetical protein
MSDNHKYTDSTGVEWVHPGAVEQCNAPECKDHREHLTCEEFGCTAQAERKLEALVEAIKAKAAEPVTLWCHDFGCMDEATHYVKTKRLPARPYCVEHAHGVAEMKKKQGHEEIRKWPIGSKR